MILLTVVAVIVTMLLVGSASARIADASRIDEGGAGGWGVMQRHRKARRAMSPHARRWQTAISRASDDDVRWAQLAAHLDSLEAAAGGSPDPESHPESLDRRYLNARIVALEAELERSPDQATSATPTASTNTKTPTTPSTAGENTQ